MVNYLNIARTENLKYPKEKLLYRCLEILPGFLSWLTLLGALFLSWMAPTVVAILIILFDFYWLLKITYLSFHQITSYKQMKKNLETDWIGKLKLLNNDWKKIYHLIILPMHKEGEEIVESSLQAIFNCQYPKDKMIVVLATEERAGKSAQKVAKKIEEKFSKKFLRFLITIHPKDIPGETKGKGSNTAWAIKTVKEKIIDTSTGSVQATSTGSVQALRPGSVQATSRDSMQVTPTMALNKPQPNSSVCLRLRTSSEPQPNSSAECPTLSDSRRTEPLKIKKENIIVSTFDVDTKPYPRYFACLTFYYLTIKNPYRASFQPIPIYNNNIWSAPNFSRVVATSNTFWQMMQQERPEALVTYSSHSLPFKVLEEVGYPKNVIPDDSRIFWKAYLFYDGEYRVVPIHYPVSMDAVLAKNLKRTIINQYHQQRRWAWGCTDIPFLLFGFFKNKKIPLSKKIYHSWNILDGFWSWAVASLLIFSLGWLPLFFGGEKFNITLLSYNLPIMTRNIMTISMIGMLISCIISFLILPQKPKKFGKLKNISLVLQWLLLPITLIIFGGFPALDAQTRLILGKDLSFWVTEKARL